MRTTSGCEEPRAVSVDSVKGIRQPSNLPTDTSRPLIPTRFTIYCTPTWELWRQLISKVAHSQSRFDPRAFQRQEFIELREHQSPLLARQSIPGDTRKRDVEARVLTPSIPAGRCVATLSVAHSACRTYRLFVFLQPCICIGSLQY